VLEKRSAGFCENPCLGLVEGQEMSLGRLRFELTAEK